MSAVDFYIDGQYAVLTMNGEGKFNPDLLSAFNKSLDDHLQSLGFTPCLISFSVRWTLYVHL